MTSLIRSVHFSGVGHDGPVHGLGCILDALDLEADSLKWREFPPLQGHNLLPFQADRYILLPIRSVVLPTQHQLDVRVQMLLRGESLPILEHLALSAMAQSRLP